MVRLSCKQDLQTVGFRVFLILLGVLIINIASSQQYSIQVNRYGVEHGVNARDFTAMEEDEESGIWFSSLSGLYQFNGYGFRSIHDQPTHDVVKGKEGRLWVGGHDGLYYLDPGSDSLYKDEVYSGSMVERIGLEGGGEAMWFTTPRKLYRYVPDGELREVFDFGEIVENKDIAILQLAVESAESIWLVMSGFGVVNVNAEGEILMHQDGFYNMVDYRKLIDGNLWREASGLSRRADADSGFVFLDLMPDKSFKLSQTFGELKLNPVAQKAFIPSQIFDQNDADMLHFFSESTSEIFVVDKKRNEKVSFELSELNMLEPYVLLRDSHGVIWIKTFEDLISIKISQNPIVQYLTGEPIETSTRSFFLFNEEDLLVNTYAGFYQLEPDGAASLWYPKSIELMNGNVFITPITLFFFSAYPEEDNIWLTSDSNGLFKYSRASNEILQFQMSDYTFSFDLTRTRSDALWLASSFGLQRVHEEEASIIPKSEKDSLLSFHWVYDLEKDRSSDFTWAATSKGLYLLDLDNLEIRQHHSIGETNPAAKCLLQDADGVIWVASEAEGLVRITPETGEKKVFTKASHGLSDNRIVGILEESDSVLWLSSFNGLMRFNKVTHSVRSFFEEDGLTHNEFNLGSAYKAADGRMFFGGIRGVNSFYPSQLAGGGGQNEVLLSEVMKYDSRVRGFVPAQKQLREENKLKLTRSEDFFTLDFYLNDHSDPQSNVFAYKMEGIDDNWIDLGNQHNMRLNTPGPGSYTLLIRGRGTDGVWTQNPLVIQIEVPVPFLQRIEFIISAVFVGLLLVFGIVRWRTRSLELAKSRLEDVVKERTIKISSQNDLLTKQAEKLRNLDEAKSRFFANISHELRTPLTLILGHTDQLLQSGDASSESVSLGLQTTRQNAESLLGLIEEIMALSKLEAGRIVLDLQVVRPYHFISRIADIYATAGERKGILFVHKAELSEDVALRMDLSKVEKVLNNLLSNAIKFTAAKGTVTFEVALSGEVLVFKVRDTGRGIHEDDLPHIFERFYQSEQKDAPVEGGTGIGLSLVYELVRLMDGDLKVSSVLGKGSLFTCTLPVTQVEVPEELYEFPNGGEDRNERKPLPEEEGEPDYGAVSTRQATVLLVEDHREMRAFIKQVLTQQYIVREAGDGKSALNVLQQYHIDLVVSDYMMPEMDGLQLLAAMKEMEAMRSIPVILLTARSEMEDKLKALTLGVDEYMLKPFNPNELLVRVKNLLAYQAERQQWLLASEEETLTLSEEDAFMSKAQSVVMEKLDDPNFGVIDLAESVLTSQRSLSRKLKQFTGMSPGLFITEVRLQEARKLLESRGQLTISEIMFKVGFQSGGHFSGQFKKRFGKTPSDYLSEEAVSG